MDPPLAAEVETQTEKTEQTKSHDCGLCDIEVVYKIAQELLPGLASSCVDNTTGGLFTSAGTVAVDIRNEMTDYLTKRSETYVAEYLLSENTSMLELSEHPYDIILNLIDDFASSKTNMLSRVSEWVASDRREDRIDDFVQEMEINGFWLLPRREYVASMLLKNVDYKNSFHCNKVCNSEEELVKHRSECMFRPMDCTNEGCTTRYCAAQKEHHEAGCPFTVLQCEQRCSDFVMRREMDRHCVTICPMKLVNCAFFTVGCTFSIPRCSVQQHNADTLSLHLLYIIKTAHKEASNEDLKHRVEQIRRQSNIERLARARDARALTYLIKDVEAKLGPLVVKTKPHEDNNKKESPTKTEPSVVKDGVDSTKKKVEHQGSESAIDKRPSTVNPVITEDDTKLPTKNEPSEVKDGADPPKKKEERQGSQSAIDTKPSTEKPVITDDDAKLPTKTEPSVVKDGADQPKKKEEHQRSQSAIDTRPTTEKPIVTDENTKLPTKEVYLESLTSTDPPIQLDGNIDKDNDGSFSSPMEEHELAVTEHTARSPEGEKVKDELINTVIEKTKQLAGSDEEDPKKSQGKETGKGSPMSDEEGSFKSTTKETVKESSHQRENVNELSDSDDEAMMTPLETD